MSTPILTQAYLKSLFDYDPETGVFVRLQSARTDRIGQRAGHLNAKGYVAISVDNKLYYAHRLAWLYMTGTWPSDLIDHRDTDKSNNRFLNLRVTDDKGNKENRIAPHANTASGVLGVYGRNSRWYSKIKINGRQVYLGEYDTVALAHQAYVTAKRANHSTCTL